MRLAEGRRDDLVVLDEPGQRGLSSESEPGREDDARLQPGRSAYPRCLRRGKGVDDTLETRFLADDRQNGRGGDDHAPPSPYPRISSRSSLDSDRPSSSGGNSGQISSSSSLISRSSRSPAEGRVNDSSTWRKAYRTAPVLVSPVSAATSLASRSVSGSLMLSAMG